MGPMKRSVAKNSAVMANMTRKRRAWPRRWAGIAVIFAAGIGLGTMSGGWLAGQGIPVIQVALTLSPPPPAPLLKVRVRAFRPQTREPPVAAAPPANAPPATAPPIQRPASPLSRPAATIMRAGRNAWLANAVPSPAAAGRPMIAIVIDDLGIDQTRSRRAIALPAPLTLALIPYGYNLKLLSKAGRKAGHELLVHVNMEPTDRDIDAGPHALLTGLKMDEIRTRLAWALSRFEGYIGISNHMGSRFTEWPDGVEAVLQELRGRGLLFLDSVTSQKSVGAALAQAHGMAYASRDIFLDNDRTASRITLRLAETERLAKRRGYAIAIGHPHDVTLQALKSWIPAVKKRGFVLVPLSAIVRWRMGEG